MAHHASLFRNRSFAGLTAAQFLEAANDNLFKMVVSLFAIQSDGGDWLWLAGIAFSAPYLLFSRYAGTMADTFPKRSVMVTCKIAEIGIGLCAAAMLASTTRMEVLLLILFLLAGHSAFFSPAKYGSVPEMVRPEQLARATAILEATRYTAVIAGSATGALLMQIWRGTPLRIGWVTVVIAILGLICTLLIKPGTLVQRRSAFGRHLRLGFKRIAGSRSLTMSVASVTIFDMIATLSLMDVLLLARTELGLGDGAAGIVSVFAASGAILGALLYGWISRNKIELGLAPIAGSGFGLSLAAASVASGFLSVDLSLLALGAFGGMFIVPFIAWMQRTADEGEKGLILSTANFVDMGGLMIASALLGVLHDALGLGAREILAAAGLVAIGYALLLPLLWKRVQMHLAMLLHSFVAGVL